jgi:Cys-rich repeat protein
MTDADCEAGDVCKNGSCVPAGCKTNSDCSTGQFCSNGVCVPEAGCKVDSECAAGDYCKSDGLCTPKLPTGATCGGANQCLSGVCDQSTCDGLIASGSGILCAAGPAPGSFEGMGAAISGIALAMAGLMRRRRR